ncbi:serine hydrolase [Jeotgalibacillus sp. ET6]|uniref:serine hydrolase domain-containing protein n=1 Tax=Jeotgalibacillus sp. ET6 TaxID=3037260 RepID=UPI0024184165|nr:serine hydrolase [Jeotgalibacillus sp. ET6]MDG5473641.1 serine hydrolase [Jeotgalibacillus sp. ET6]
MSGKKNELDRVIEDNITQVEFSGVVYMKQGSEVLAQAAYDYANRSDQLLNTVHTRFGIASGCKVFTAIGICQLVDEGILSFETSINEYLDIHFPAFDEKITIHHLLTHTSGMPDYFDEEVMDDYEELWEDLPVYKMRTLNDFLPLFQHKNMMFLPGDRFHYNNAGYLVLGLIIEQQTGMKFTEYIESKIFKKCGMNESGYFSMDQLPGKTALGYIDDEENGTWRTNSYSLPIKGGADGGAYTTGPDMIKLWEALFEFELLSEQQTTLLLHPHVHVEERVNYGYGVWMNKRKDTIFKYHVMGYDPGVSFCSSVYPEYDLKLAILSNKESGPSDVASAIENDYITRW